MGIADIPSTTTSKLCSEAFSKNTKGFRILMKCVFVPEKCKWRPLEQDTKVSVPTNISDVENMLDIVEDESDDSQE